MNAPQNSSLGLLLWRHWGGGVVEKDDSKGGTGRNGYWRTQDIEGTMKYGRNLPVYPRVRGGGKKNQ